MIHKHDGKAWYGHLQTQAGVHQSGLSEMDFLSRKYEHLINFTWYWWPLYVFKQAGLAINCYCTVNALFKFHTFLFGLFLFLKMF